MDEYEIDQAAVHIYSLAVSKKETETINYCTILEIHSPQYLSSEWLQALYVDQYDQYSDRSKIADDFLARLEILITEFPKH